VSLKEQYLTAHGKQKAEFKQTIQKQETEIAHDLRLLRAKGIIMWRVQFAEAFSKRGGFDIVLANPPYIRQELIKDLKPTLKKVYGDQFSGTADLYVFFYLRAIQLLRKGGMLVFISSNKWFRAGYGEKLRSLIARETTVQTILDFHDLPVFESAIAYPMIFIAGMVPPHKEHGATLVEPPTLDSPYPDVTAVVTKFGQRLPAAALGADGTWHLASSSAADRFKKMRAAGRPLGEIVKGQFYRGVVTGLNEAFYVSGSTAKKLLESKRGAKYVKKALRGEYARRYSFNDEGLFLLRIPNGLTLTLLGYEPENFAVGERAALVRKLAPKAWAAFEDHLPGIAEHLMRFRDAARARDDQGDFWWELRPCDYYCVFDAPKIIFPQTGKNGRFTLDSVGFDLDQTVYTVACDDRFLLAVLNSKAVECFLKETTALARGGYLRFLTQYFKTLPIPDASAADRAAIATLAQKCLDAKGVNCQAWEKEIDERVAALYGIDLADLEK
jgi:hypothetical protein